MPCWRMQGPRQKRLKKEETERVHDLLLEERLEEEREWLNELQNWFEGQGLRVKQGEGEQGPESPFAMAAEHQSETMSREGTGL